MLYAKYCLMHAIKVFAAVYLFMGFCTALS